MVRSVSRDGLGGAEAYVVVGAAPTEPGENRHDEFEFVDLLASTDDEGAAPRDRGNDLVPQEDDGLLQTALKSPIGPAPTAATF